MTWLGTLACHPDKRGTLTPPLEVFALTVTLVQPEPKSSLKRLLTLLERSANLGGAMATGQSTHHGKQKEWWEVMLVS